jgi:hypothetical protein
MAKHTQPEAGHKRGRTVLAASFAVAGLAIAGAGVFAGLNAVATGTEAVNSGSLKLVQLAGTGSGGFGQTYSDMAPGDAKNTYVDVTDTGTIAAQNMTLAVVGTGATLLTTDATKGLHITVQSCTVAFVAGNCADLPLGAAMVVNNVAVSALSTPASTVAGAIAKNSAYHYKITTTLPDQNETTTNGTLPGGTIQLLSTTLTFTFNEVQRAATTVES